MLKISVKSYLNSEPEQLEKSGEAVDQYTVDGTNYYIVRNNSVLQVAWVDDSYECYISGEISVEEIQMMIDSIVKG